MSMDRSIDDSQTPRRQSEMLIAEYILGFGQLSMTLSQGVNIHATNPVYRDLVTKYYSICAITRLHKGVTLPTNNPQQAYGVLSDLVSKLVSSGFYSVGEEEIALGSLPFTRLEDIIMKKGDGGDNR